MSEIPSELYYTDDHEWVRKTGDDTVRVGITDYAQAALGDVVYVELPEVGADVTAGGEFGTVESTKSTSDLFAPITAKVVAVNGEVPDSPELVNSDPYGAGWLIELQLDAASLAEALDGLLDADSYEASLDE
ncbi:MAG: glycine cleavage system protein GcvH [Mycobacterium sp.]